MPHPIVRKDDDEHPCAVTRLQGERSFGGFAGAGAVTRQFQTVVQSVAEEVGQRGFKFFENVAVHLGVRTDKVQAGGLAERSGEVTHETRETLGAVGEGTHPAELGLTVKTPREVGGTANEAFEFLVARGESFGAGGGFAAGFVELVALGGGQRSRGEGSAEVFQEGGEVPLPTPGAQEAIGVRREPAGFHERLARETEEAIEAVRRDAQDALGCVHRRQSGWSGWFEVAGRIIRP